MSQAGFIQLPENMSDPAESPSRIGLKTAAILARERAFAKKNLNAAPIGSMSALSIPPSGKNARTATTKSRLDPIARSGPIEDDDSTYGHQRWEFNSSPNQRDPNTRRVLTNTQRVPTNTQRVPIKTLGNIEAPQTGMVASALPAGSLLNWRHTKARDKARLEELRSRVQEAAGEDLLSKSGCARYTRKLDLATGKWSERLDNQVKSACERHLLSPLENAGNQVLAQGRCKWNDEYKYCDFETKEEREAREATEKVARQEAAKRSSIGPLVEAMKRNQEEREAREAAKSGWLGSLSSWAFGKGGNRGTRRSKNKRRSRRKQTHSKVKSRSRRRRRIRRRRTKRSVPAIQK